jgi:hypothetical protein
MLEVFFGAVLALAARDVYLELIERYRQYIFKRNIKSMNDLLEDIEADDEDIK